MLDRRTPRRPAARGAIIALATGLLLVCLVPTAGADENRIERLLHRAEHLENIEGSPEEAVPLYEKVLAFETVPAAERGRALRALARIHLAAGRTSKAETYWERIQGDKALDAGLRLWAERQIEDHRKVDPAELSPADDHRRRQEILAAEKRRLVKTALNAARAALQAGRFEEARRKVFTVLELDRKNAEANEILTQIEARSPDRDDMWRQLLTLFESQDLVEYDRIREEVQRRSRAARVLFDKGDWKEADHHYREAIRLIDESGFLGFGGAVDTNSLDELRAGLVEWLRQVHSRGKKEGLSFEPEPPLPDLAERQGSLRARALAFFADVMRPPRDGSERIHFFEFRPDLKRGTTAKRSLSRTLADGIDADDSEGNLTRTRWAERWIRKHIGTRWTDGLRRRGGSKASKRGRLLVRLGNHIAAECGEREQRRIAKLEGDFVSVPPSMRIDVQLFAVSSAGAVGASETLRLATGPRERGLDHVVHNALISTCVRDINTVGAGAPTQPIKHLGGARLAIDGLTSRLLSFTKLTAAHPDYAAFPSAPKEITVDAADARYGLWLDLYVEDMEGRRSGPNKTPTSAVSVVARVKYPDRSVPSHIVPKKASAEMPFTRLPVFVERTLEADRAVPHFGTFVLQGLPNPFPESRDAYPELIVLIGTTREDTPTPDPPRASNGGGPIVPSDVLVRDYPVGSLSIEVDDQIVPEAWPELRTAKDGVPAADRRRLRDRNLADTLMQLAGIDVEGPGGRDAIVVQDHRATGTLGEAGQVRLQRALQKLAAHENDLYQVRVRAGVVPNDLWTAWVGREGVTRNQGGNYLVAAAAREAIERELLPFTEAEGPFVYNDDLLARATQQVAAFELASHSIRKDLYVRRLSKGVRVTPVPGVAEEGLVIEVRPMLEREGGVRFVRVRARAARLRTIETVQHPQADLPAAVYDVPRWHAGNERAGSDVRDSELLGDDNALLVPLPLPGSSEERIAVLISVRKVQ